MHTDDRLGKCIEYARVSILCLGSGDGSQQKAIVEQGHRNLTATFFDLKSQLLAKYPTARANLEFLETNAKVFYGIDATRLDEHAGLVGKHDIVSFSFPHTGKPNAHSQNVASNQMLLKGLIGSVSHVLKPGGSVEVTLKPGEPYDKWELQSLVKESTGLDMISTHPLNEANFPGYVHRLTKGAMGMDAKVKHAGATVYEFGRSGEIPAARTEPAANLSSLGGRILMVVVVADVLTDEQIMSRAVEILNNEKSRGDSRLMDVLQIRRKFDERGQPDTRALNRALYALEASGTIEKCTPAKGKHKPRWKVALSSEASSCCLRIARFPADLV
jgi:hypothetical protein